MAENALKTALRELARNAGAQACGFARATAVDDTAVAGFYSWIEQGHHASMGYLENHAEVRRDPRRLLDSPDNANGHMNSDEACTIMVCAFSYYHPEAQATDAARIAMYAHGSDYHEVLRERLRPMAAHLEALGLKARICIDTAPLRERYWAVKAGVGFIGRNGQLIVGGMGSYFFLASVIFNAAVEPDAPCTDHCLGCGRCIASCPGKALDGNGTCDARRCLSYLTIENRGPLPPHIDFPDGTSRPIAAVMDGRVYGCDECQRVCPHNINPPLTEIAEFRLRPTLANLTPADILALDQLAFSTLFKASAIKRAKLSGLQRNALAIHTKTRPPR